jgi:Fur family ferric uptake transcriptional regulator
VCVKCGRVEEFYDPEIEKRQEDAAKSRGFTMHEHSLMIYGICSKQPCGPKK